MEKNSNRGIWIIVGILSVLVLLLAVLVAILLFGGKREKQGGTGNAGPFGVNEKTTQSAEEDTTDFFGHEIKKENKVSSNGVTMVIDGFQFNVPADYDCFYSDEIGPVVYLDDIFQMKTVVRGESYAKAMQEPDALMEKTIAAGGEIIQNIKETELNGKKYAYFIMKLFGDTCFVGYTQASDTDKSFGTQIVMESDSLTDEDLLHIFADVTGGAQVTDAPNSTYDDIVAQVAAKSSNLGEYKEMSGLRIDGAEVAFSVPKNFYYQSGGDTESPGMELFMSGDMAVTVNCYLALADEFVENAKMYVQCELDFAYESLQEDMEIQTMDIDGRTCYYLIQRYKYKDSYYQKVCAACDVEDNAYYAVKATAIDADIELSMDTIREFFVLFKIDK